MATRWRRARATAISGIPAEAPDAVVFHAGTALEDGELRTSGGRVLCVTVLADSVKLAQQRAYEVAARIQFDGAQYRKDIGHRAVQARAQPLMQARARTPSATTCGACSSASSRRSKRRWRQRCVRDAWQKEPGEPLQGSGLTCILEGGALFERAGCGFSQVRGPRCRLRPPSTGPNWPARRSRRWACRWCSTRAIPTCRPCT